MPYPKLCLLFAFASFAMAAGGRVEFNRDVRPIFSDKCYTCHGPDAAAKHVPFRLDSEAAARKAAQEVVDELRASVRDSVKNA